MATFSDDFNRADSTDLGANWVEVSGTWSIVSNQLSPGSAGGTIILRAALNMDTNDNYCQVTITGTASLSHGIWCRGNSNITSGYLWRNDGSSWNLFYVVGGSFNNIGAYAAAAAPGDVARVQAVGSTIKGFVNGVERVSVTDTNVPTGTTVGVRSESSASIRFDNFSAGDVTSSTTLPIAFASEVGTARSITGVKTASLGAATASGQARSLAGIKTGPLGTAAATSQARPLAGFKTAMLVHAQTVHTAQTLTGTRRATLGPAHITEQCLPLSVTKTGSILHASQVESARTLTAVSDLTPSPERTYVISSDERRLYIPVDSRIITVER